MFHCWKHIWCWKLPCLVATSENDSLHIYSLWAGTFEHFACRVPWSDRLRVAFWLASFTAHYFWLSNASSYTAPLKRTESSELTLKLQTSLLLLERSGSGCWKRSQVFNSQNLDKTHKYPCSQKPPKVLDVRVLANAVKESNTWSTDW
jgi:hypothetical protein